MFLLRLLLLSCLFSAYHVFTIPEFTIYGCNIEPTLWQATQHLIQNHVSFNVVNQNGLDLNAYMWFVHTCEQWSVDEFTRYFNYYLNNQHINEQQILTAYEFYRYAPFQEYVSTLSGYTEHIEQLYKHIDCGKKCKQRVRHITGIDRKQFGRTVKKLHQDLQNKHKREDQARRQQAALCKQQEKQRICKQETQHAMSQQHDQLVTLLMTWQDTAANEESSVVAMRYAARSNAAEKTLQGNDQWYERTYVMSADVRRELTNHQISADKFGILYGNALQQVLHKELVDVVDGTAQAYGSYKHISVVKNLGAMVFEFADVGREYNLHGATVQASKLADFCWAALDCIQAIGEGVCDGVVNTVDMILDPIKTVTNITKGVGMLAYHVGHVMYELTELDLLMDTDYEAAQKKFDDMSNRFGLAIAALQKKQKELELRDYFKGAATFVTECYLQARLIRGVSMLCESAQKQIPKLVSQFGEYVPDKKFLLSTAEGIEVSIAEESTLFLKKDNSKLNILSEHESQTVSLVKEQSSVSQKTCELIKEIEKRKGAPLPGYKGGRVFENYDHILPKGISYREYDIYPYAQGQNRGAERLILGSDGSAWYTCDHYKTFSRIK